MILAVLGQVRAARGRARRHVRRRLHLEPGPSGGGLGAAARAASDFFGDELLPLPELLESEPFESADFESDDFEPPSDELPDAAADSFEPDSDDEPDSLLSPSPAFPPRP